MTPKMTARKAIVGNLPLCRFQPLQQKEGVPGHTLQNQADPISNLTRRTTPGRVLPRAGVSQASSPWAGGKPMSMCVTYRKHLVDISLLPLCSQHLPALLPSELADRASPQAMENELPVPHTSSSASVASSASSGCSSGSSGGSGRPAGPQISVYSGIPDRQTVQVRFRLI